MSPDFCSAAMQSRRLTGSWRAFQEGTAWKWLLFSPTDRVTVRGFVHFSQIVRGAFHSSMLGYAVDQDWQGQGLMREALTLALAEVFSERGRLHRVQANVMPENVRSLRLLDALGFQSEGVAKEYLHIDGRWRDHVMTALVNSGHSSDWL